MNLSISPGKNNVGAYINVINLKSLDIISIDFFLIKTWRNKAIRHYSN